jgi:hypothetical protein
MKRYKEIKENQCEVKGCECNVNYILGAIAVIFIVIFIATSIN